MKTWNAVLVIVAALLIVLSMVMALEMAWNRVAGALGVAEIDTLDAAAILVIVSVVAIVWHMWARSSKG
jgi:hypothetical protein